MRTLEEEEYDPLFEIECIKQHSINRHEVPILHISWACGGSSWLKMAVVKEDDPVLVAEYIVSNDLRRNPKWRYKWATRYLFKIKRLGRALGMNINIFQRRATNKTTSREMHRITILKNRKQALEFDKRFENNKWRDSIKKEISNMIEFKVPVQIV